MSLGTNISRLRAEKRLSQGDLAEVLEVSRQSVSKWETGRGLPDLSLLEGLAAALGVSVAELLSGEQITNQNRSANPLRGKFYVCPVCGNVIHAMGEGAFHCCGVALPPLEVEESDEEHQIHVPEILLPGFALRPHQLPQFARLAVPFAELHDPPFDQRTVEPEIGLVGVVVSRDLVVGEHRVDRTIDVVLVQLADQQRPPELLDHLVDVGRRGGEKRLRLLQLELLDDPAIDEDPHESRAVFAREPLRNHRTHVAYLQLLAAGPRDGRIAREITGQLPATRQQQRTRRDRYFRSHIHIPKGKDTFFTCK